MIKFCLRLTLLLTLTILATACQHEEPPPAEPVKQQRPAAATGSEAPAPPAPITGLSVPAPTPASAPATRPVVTPTGSVVFMEQGITLARGETIADALPVWRRFAAQKPALLLLSNDPALLPPPSQLQPQIDAVMATGTDAALRQAGNPTNPAMLLLPGMAVDLALRQGWLRELVWAFPQRDLKQEVELKKFREQMTANNVANVDELATLKLADKIFSGRLRGAPFSAGPLPHLQKLEGPLLVHIDLSYFQKFYKSEITTPVIPLVGNVLQQLKAKKLPVLAVTFSYNHADGSIPLNVRFVGEFISALVEKPERLDQPLPKRWAAQKDILYLENFFQKDEIRKLVEQQAQESPKAAWVQFNRYHTAGLFKEGDQALAYLAQASVLDRMYATEYLQLAQRAYETKQLSQSLRMMKLAGAAFPENPMLKLQTAHLAMETGDTETARKLVRELQKLSWSTVYYPNMPGYLEGLLAEIDK